MLKSFSKTDLEDYLSIIQDALDLNIVNYEIIDKGWTNLVFDINNRWIVRFTKHKSNKQIEIEKDFLPKFAPQSPIPIPEPIKTLKLTNAESTTELNFIAYKRINGERCSYNRLSNFQETELQRLYKAIGDFLTTLHASEYKHPNLLAYPYGGEDFWNDVWPVVEPYLTQNTKIRASNFFKQSLKQFTPSHEQLKLTHSDLGPNNILLNNSKNELAGIIDFGDMALADPAIDFSSFYRNFGQNFVENVLKYYDLPIDDDFMLRVDYQSKRKLFFVCYFAKYYGYEADIPQIVKVIETIF